MKYPFAVFMLSTLVFTGSALAAEDAAQAPVPTVATPAAAAAAPAIPALFLKPVFLRGTLGDAKVQVSIRPKADIGEGVEGEYFVFGRSLKILLAGEIEGDALFMEESENGTDISGQWDGKLQGDTLSGKWTSADGASNKPFSLQVIANSASVKKISAKTKKH